MRRADALKTALAEFGLVMRGSFVPQNNDNVPSLSNRSAPISLTLIGNIGSSLWRSFSTSAEFKDRQAHPLDRWSKRVGDQLASDFNGLALYPFDGPPYWPFLTWTQKAEGLIPSPLGLNFHPHYGLWHAYRFALLLQQNSGQGIDVQVQANNTFDCTSCKDQPCLKNCPVDAFDGQNYATNNCVSYLNSYPEARCNSHGCLARHACPIGKEFAYLPQQASFHMQAFKAARKPL